MIEDFVYDFLRTQFGAWKDETEPTKKDVYHIRIRLDLSDDTFYVDSDTGNKGLMTGIVFNYASRLGIAA